MRARTKIVCLLPLLVALATVQAQTTSSTRAPAGRVPARGPLPDPALLDGSNQPAEKKPDYGMLGQFEIPGDENSKSGKVGGQQNPHQQGGGGGGQQPPNGQQQQGGGGMAGGLPQAGGGASGGQQPAGAPGAAGAQGAQQAGAGGAAGNQQINPAGLPGGGPMGQPGDPNAKADGIQVAGLEGDPSQAGAGGAGGATDNVQKPQQVAIGDPTMQIKPAPGAAGAVGQVTAGSTQQMESKIGKGGGGGGGSPTTGGGGRGVEKGRTMPSGL